MRPWNTEYRVSSGGIEYFPLTMRSFAPSSNGCCRKHSRYKMQPRACGGEAGGGDGGEGTRTEARGQGRGKEVALSSNLQGDSQGPVSACL